MLKQKACNAWNFVSEYVHLWRESQISIRAAALTYTFILGLIPALALIFAIFSVFIDIPTLRMELKFFLLNNLATGSGENVMRYIDQFLSKVRFKTVGIVGFGGLFVTGMMLMSSIQDSMNWIWRIKNTQKMWMRFLLYQAFFALGPVGIAITMAALAFLVKLSPKFFYPAQLASILLAAILFSAMYKILPATKVKMRNAFIAALVAAICVELAKRGYAVYTAKALFYSKVYGGLAVLPFFLIWIYLNWIIFLSGTQLNFLLDKREASK